MAELARLPSLLHFSKFADLYCGLRGTTGLMRDSLTTLAGDGTAGRQYLRNVVRQHRPAEQVALAVGAASRPQHHELVLQFDAFRRDVDAEAVAEPCHRRDDRGAIRTRRHFGDERLIDLDAVEGEPTQIGQRRVSRAEVVKRDADAEVARPMQRYERILVVVE